MLPSYRFLGPLSMAPTPKLVACASAYVPREPLTGKELRAIEVAAESAFMKLANLYERIVPFFEDQGFTPPSAGVVARDLSEKIETSIRQHARTFTKGLQHCDLARFNKQWEVKVCKDTGLTINQSKVIAGENYIVVNYKDNIRVNKIWVLWEARDDFFSPRKSNSNARALNQTRAASNIQVIYSAPREARQQPQ
jgi:ferritin-like protein